eukprot:GEZU01017721.1.p1 GENE.GEZU01017721.1~~GEZU01017721.1.p1  ORF type:complete len:345 (-),score=21.82 GEZU01017721.1:554-1588(-)
MYEGKEAILVDTVSLDHNALTKHHHDNPTTKVLTSKLLHCANHSMRVTLVWYFISAVAGGFQDADRRFCDKYIKDNVPLIFVLSKADLVTAPSIQKLKNSILKRVPYCDGVFALSNTSRKPFASMLRLCSNAAHPCDGIPQHKSVSSSHNKFRFVLECNQCRTQQPICPNPACDHSHNQQVTYDPDCNTWQCGSCKTEWDGVWSARSEGAELLEKSYGICDSYVSPQLVKSLKLSSNRRSTIASSIGGAVLGALTGGTAGAAAGAVVGAGVGAIPGAAIGAVGGAITASIADTSPESSKSETALGTAAIVASSAIFALPGTLAAGLHRLTRKKSSKPNQDEVML